MWMSRAEGAYNHNVRYWFSNWNVILRVRPKWNLFWLTKAGNSVWAACRLNYTYWSCYYNKIRSSSESYHECSPSLFWMKVLTIKVQSGRYSNHEIPGPKLNSPSYHPGVYEVCLCLIGLESLLHSNSEIHHYCMPIKLPLPYMPCLPYQNNQHRFDDEKKKGRRGRRTDKFGWTVYISNYLPPNSPKMVSYRI